MTKFTPGKSGNPRGRPRKDTQAVIANNDGWTNVMTGLMAAQDPARHTRMAPVAYLQENEVSAIFVGDGLGRRIVEMPAEEAVRPWFKIEGEEGGAVCDFFETMWLQRTITDAYVWARLYGGAGIVRLVADGQDLDQPMRTNSIQRVIGYRVYDRWRINWTSVQLQQDPNNPRYGMPETYQITPINSMPFTVHHSRISLIDGRRLPDNERARNNYWGASVLQGILEQLTRVGSSHGYANGIVRDFVQAVLGIKGLSDMFAAGQDDIVKKRIQLLDLSRSIMNMMVLDSDGEQYSKTASSIAGLAELLGKFEGMLSSVTGIPITKLYGSAPGGLNATGESDMRNFYDMLDSDRKDKLNGVLESMVREVYLSKEGPTRGVQPESWSIKWNSLWQMTDTETATLRKTVAETDAIYLDRSVLGPDEVGESRFGQGEWSMHTEIETEPEANEGDDVQTPEV